MFTKFYTMLRGIIAAINVGDLSIDKTLLNSVL